jgi:hypothetical protein
LRSASVPERFSVSEMIGEQDGNVVLDVHDAGPHSIADALGF